jgi:hypothetical protein
MDGKEYTLSIKTKNADFIKEINKEDVLEQFGVSVVLSKPITIIGYSIAIFAFENHFTIEEARIVWDELVNLGFGLTGKTAKTLRNK